jgi:hypothetical protein
MAHVDYLDLNSYRKVETHTDAKELYGIPDPNEGTTWMQTRDWGRVVKPIGLVDYVTDAGWIFGGGVETRHFRFDRSPYGMRHIVRGGYVLGAKQPIGDYFGEFRRRQHRSFFALSANLSGLENLRYYGLGNETEGSESADRYRVDSMRVKIFPTWTWAKGPVFQVPSFSEPPARSTVFGFGPVLKYGSSTGDSGSILDDERPYGMGRFGQLGVGTAFLHDGRRSQQILSAGIKASAEAYYFFPVWDVESRFGSVSGSLSGYLPLGSRVLIATTVEGKRVFGDYPFFEAAYLGGRRSLRGYMPNRYAGDGALVGAAELRVRVATLGIPIPGTIGVIGGSKVGRVFLEEEDSSKWHPAVGGGVFFEMLRGLSVFSLSGWQGRDDFTVHFKAGFDF